MSLHPFRFILLVTVLLGIATGIYLLVSRPENTQAPLVNTSSTPTPTTSTVNFQFPETIASEYVSTVDWPPQVQTLNEPFTCTEAGVEFDRAGKTEKHIVNGRTYCVTTVSEGAAGSIYTQYAYAFEKNSQTVIFVFTLRFPQCVNYDEPEQRACKNDQAVFDLDNKVDTIVKSITD